VKLVKADQHGLSEIQRGVLGRRNGDDGLQTIENVVGETIVFAAEDHCDRAIAATVQHLRGSTLGIEDGPFRGAAPRGKAYGIDAIGDGVVE
jgi:hypothetical protein